MGCAASDRVSAEESPNYTSLPALRQCYETTARTLAFAATTREEWERWHATLLSKLATLVGELPSERVPLDPIVLESGDTPDYAWQKIAFASEPRVHVPCYVLIPHNARLPYRPVIALHGHGVGGAAHLLGRMAGSERCAEQEAHIRYHNYDYAGQLARRGLMVFAPELRGMGERLETEPGSIDGEPMWRNSCRVVALNALLVGRTAIGLRVWDVMRTVDYIRTRPEPMTASIGCLGFSAGGTTTLYATALEPRITVAALCSSLCTYRASVMAANLCCCNYLPGVLKYAEMADIAGLIAPRPLFVASGTEDAYYSIAGARAAFADLQRVYAMLGVPERATHAVFEGWHRFIGAPAIDWLDRWMPGAI